MKCSTGRLSSHIRRKHPPVSYLLDGLSRQASIETEDHIEDGIEEEDLSHATYLVEKKTHLGVSEGTLLPVYL